MRRDVELLIRAKAEGERQINAITGALHDLVAAGGNTGALNGELKQLIETLGAFGPASKSIFQSADSAANSFEQQRSKVQGLKRELQQLEAQRISSVRAAAQVKVAGTATGDTAGAAAKIKDIETAQRDLEKAITRTTGRLRSEEQALESLRAEAQKLGSMANAADALGPQVANAKQAAETARAMQDQAEAAERIRNMLNPALAIQKRFAAEIDKIRKNEALSAKERLQAEKLLNAEMQREIDSAGKGEKGALSAFGLKPYELTNLGYQVNDIVTGLASGQGLMQIMAQQGGQLIQLFPRLGSTIIAALSNPAVLAAAAVFGAIALGIKEAADQADRLRVISGILRANADGANYTTKALEANVQALDHMGMSAEEALSIVRALVKEGVNPEFVNSFGLAARNAALLYPELGNVEQAAQQVAKAFTAGYDAIVELDDATNFLTAQEREHIRVLFDSGKAAEARELAFRKFSGTMNDAADQSRSNWSKAAEHLDEAWGRLMRTWGNTAPIQGVITLLDRLADVMDRISGSSDDNGLSALRKELEAVNGAIEKRQASLDRGRIWGGAKAELEESLKELRARQAQLTLQIGFAEQQAQTPTGADPKDDTQASAKRLADARAEIKLQADLLNATTDVQKVRMAGEQAYRDEIRKTGDEAVAQVKRQAAESAEQTRIQQGRRQELFGFAQSFLGRREDNRQDNAVLQSLFSQFGIKAPQGGNVDPEKLAWCAAFVNAVLAGKGIKGTGSLSAASFKNFGTGVGLDNAQKGDIVVIKSKNAASGSHVGFFDGFGPNGNVRVLGGNQGKGSNAVTVDTFARDRVQAVRRVGSIAEGFDTQDAELQIAQELAVAQSDYNKKLADEVADRQLAIKYLKEQLGMSAEQVLASQRQHEIDEAIKNARREAAERNIEFTDEQKKSIEESVGAQFDLQHAEERINAVLSEQQQLRDALLQGIQDASNRGDDQTVTRLTEELQKAEPAMNAALDAAENFWKQFDSPEAHAAIENIRRLRQEVADTAAQLAKLKFEKIGREIGGATALQGALKDQIGTAQLLGDGRGAKEAEKQFQEINLRLIEMRQRAIEVAQGMLQMSDSALQAAGYTREGLEATIVQLQQAQQETALMGRQFLMTGQQINEMLADHIVSGFENFLNMVAQGKGVFKSLGIAAAQTAASILMDLGKMILKQAIFNAIAGPTGAGGVGGMLAASIGALFPAAVTLSTAGGTLMAAGGMLTASATAGMAYATTLMAAAQMLMVANAMGSAGVLHGGGMAGAAGMSRSVSPAVFAGAPRFHRGGLPGLRSDEVPAILQRGEEVITRNDPRHILNGGKNTGGSSGGGGQGDLLIGLFNPDDVPRAMASAKGRRTLIAMFKNNTNEFKQALGIK